MSSEQPATKRVTIDWPAVIAGAGAAVTVAVLLSTLGAAGTIVGAALGSSVATIATAVYKQGINASRRKVAEVQAAALMRVGLAQEEVRRAAARADSETVETDLARAEAHLDKASSRLGAESDQAVEGTEEKPLLAVPEASDPEAPEPPANRWAALPWRRIALLAVAFFLVALLIISVFEVLVGRSVSSMTGGSHGKRTSITGIFGDSTGSTHHEPGTTPTPPSPTVTVTVPSTSQAPTPSAPTTAPTTTTTPSDSAPSPTPSETTPTDTTPTELSPSP